MGIKIGNIDLGDFPLLLAPMEDVSDPPFRAICKQQGADMMYTEFISSEGLIRDAEKSVQKLDIYDFERPIGIQIFGGNMDSMIEATKIVEQAKPRLNRSELAVPGSNPSLFEKAAKSNVDVIFLDLEDAVAPDEKEQARKNIIEGLNDIDWNTKTMSVRILSLIHI